jgi:hypothetical protein
MAKKGPRLHSQARELICSVHEYFQTEAENTGSLIRFRKVQDRVAAAYCQANWQKDIARKLP